MKYVVNQFKVTKITCLSGCHILVIARHEATQGTELRTLGCFVPRNDEIITIWDNRICVYILHQLLVNCSRAFLP